MIRVSPGKQLLEAKNERLNGRPAPGFWSLKVRYCKYRTEQARRMKLSCTLKRIFLFCFFCGRALKKKGRFFSNTTVEQCTGSRRLCEAAVVLLKTFLKVAFDVNDNRFMYFDRCTQLWCRQKKKKKKQKYSGVLICCEPIKSRCGRGRVTRLDFCTWLSLRQTEESKQSDAPSEGEKKEGRTKKTKTAGFYVSAVSLRGVAAVTWRPPGGNK